MLAGCSANDSVDPKLTASWKCLKAFSTRKAPARLAGNFKSGHGPSTEHLLLSDGLFAVRQIHGPSADEPLDFGVVADVGKDLFSYVLLVPDANGQSLHAAHEHPARVGIGHTSEEMPVFANA